MPRIFFWDADTQHDFMHADGRLYVPGSQEIIPALAGLTRYAHDRGIRIIATAEDHLAGHRELSDQPDYVETFPPHCMRGTPGQARIPETALRNPLVLEPEISAAAAADRAPGHDGDLLFHKHWFDPFTNPHLLPVLRALDPDVIVMYGVAQDTSARHAVEGLARHRPHTRLYFVVDASRALRPEVGEHLLKEWAEEGVRLVRAAEILEDGILGRYLDA